MNRTYEQTLDDCQAELDRIEQHIQKDKFDSLNAYLISYSVMRACGSIEFVYKNIVADSISIGATVEGTNYFDKKIRDSSSNPSTGNILRLLQDLSNDWRNKFDTRTKGTVEKGSLNSLVNLRNDLAHGGHIEVTIENVKKYFNHGRTVLDWLESVF